MGRDVSKTQFTEADHARFRKRLRSDLATLKSLLAQPGFGEGATTIGAEMELYLVDEQGFAACKNQAVQQTSGDPNVALELNQFNLEYNLPWFNTGPDTLTRLHEAIGQSLDHLREAAAGHQCRVVPIGILPTLRVRDLDRSVITPLPRYQALAEALKNRTSDGFHIHIEGRDSFDMTNPEVTLEGANTSFQLHLRVAPEQFADTFNAVQLATPVALAAAVNSPLLLGHRLWQETRIALFKQSIDYRLQALEQKRPPARVHFGHGWVRDSAWELFAEAVYLYEPLLPGMAPAESDTPTPLLDALTLHGSSVWSWNRPVYDPAGDGHLRIEMRALPAGPTPRDMVANAAFLIGLATGMTPVMRDLLPAMPFAWAKHNFYLAANHGLEAELVWPDRDHSSLSRLRATELITRLLPVAFQGLEALGIPHHQAHAWLGIIEQRVAEKQTGASWQLAACEQARQQNTRLEALQKVLNTYDKWCQKDLPVSQWPTV